MQSGRRKLAGIGNPCVTPHLRVQPGPPQCWPHPGVLGRQARVHGVKVTVSQAPATELRTTTDVAAGRRSVKVAKTSIVKMMKWQGHQNGSLMSSIENEQHISGS